MNRRQLLAAAVAAPAAAAVTRAAPVASEFVVGETVVRCGAGAPPPIIVTRCDRIDAIAWALGEGYISRERAREMLDVPWPTG